MRLPFHLLDQQQVIYAADDDIDDVLEQPSVAASMFTSWMECNKINKDARKLTYVEFPTKFVWKPNDRLWKPRNFGRSIGRIHSVSPKLGEIYFLRILLNKVKGPKSFEEIRTVNGEEFPTFRDACYALGLLDDDKEYVEAIKEASHSGTSFYMRFLFATMLMSNSLGRPDLTLNEDQLKNLTLFEIEQILLRNNTSLKNYNKMPYPDSDIVSSSTNRLIMEELDYDIPILKKECFFVYGYGGTGKTFLWKTISAAIRCKGDIVLNVASSGIASLLLPGGRTVYSRFIIPLNLTEDFVCKIPPDSELGRLVRKSSLIIWDEALMVHKHAFEALDRALKDVCKFDKSSNSKIPFGGKVIVFGRDFRQILPIVQGGSRQNIVNASLRKGKVGGSNDGEAIIDVQDDILINDPHDPIGSLIEFVYPSILEKFNVMSYFQERAILAPKNEVVQQINDCLLALSPEDEVEYLSSDCLCQSEFVHDHFDPNLYSPYILNGLKISEKQTFQVLSEYLQLLDSLPVLSAIQEMSRGVELDIYVYIICTDTVITNVRYRYGWEELYRREDVEDNPMAVEVDKSDIFGLTWMKVPWTNQLAVRIKDGLKYKFIGFRDQDVISLTNFIQNSCGLTTEKKQLSISGKNWGEVDLNG
ncbi:uncharacterized protein LOC111907790 [Lactuca sativa]|uniref:uncharacterized protein LOC111907790 n=1 Tax=Lactuca sativa TaxID=4236 RepID=UPI0022AF0EC9|nr:uncharacterized protein LOC111907790 [Lactuca sativa]